MLYFFIVRDNASPTSIAVTAEQLLVLFQINAQFSMCTDGQGTKLRLA